MFERFTASARAAVVRAQEEARDLRHGYIGSEHLLLGLLRGETGDVARTALEEFGLTYSDARLTLQRLAGPADLDAEALRSIGVDLDHIRSQVEQQFGPGALDEGPSSPGRRWLRRWAGPGGHLPFTPTAKKVLELSLREAIALQQREIHSGHVVLGLLRAGSSLGERILEVHQIPAGLLRTRVSQRLRESA